MKFYWCWKPGENKGAWLRLQLTDAQVIEYRRDGYLVREQK